MQTKQEILDKYIPCQCWPANDGGRPIYNSSCPQHSQDPETAMDEWAEIEAVAMLGWIKNNEYKTDAKGFWYEPPMYVYEGDFGLCVATNPEQLYQLYKKETQQTKTS